MTQEPRIHIFNAVGYDLVNLEKTTVEPGEIANLDTGVRITLPKGTCGQIWSRLSPMMMDGLHTIPT